VSPDEQDDRAERADRAAWEALLTDLEADAARETGAAWVEPTGLGPMPRDLVGRASRLLAAQRDRIVALEAERRSAADHLGALRSVAATREPRGAVYLDASA
jgi:hypothetical protein